MKSLSSQFQKTFFHLCSQTGQSRVNSGARRTTRGVEATAGEKKWTGLRTRMMGGSSNSEYFTASDTVCEFVTASAKTGACTTPEEQVEQHWSQLTENGDEKIAAENMQEFKALQKHPTWGHSFKTFGEDSGRSLVMGKKFAEGAQGELYEAQVKWKSASKNNRQWVLKVFKKGIPLRLVQDQWPHEWFGYRAETLRNTSLRRARPTTPRLNRYVIGADYVVLLEDGRFAFLMRRADGCLRDLIDNNMKTTRQGSGPFSKEVAEDIMYDVALSMAWLHSRNIVHRDLKAANVLFIKWEGESFGSFVADFDASRGVSGTRYFRAPEVMKACKEGNPYAAKFTKAVDVYSYGMTCYEILTGNVPFHDHPYSKDYDLILKGNRPKVPEYVDGWIHKLLRRCWEGDPEKRPTFVDIMCFLEAHSAVVRKMITETGLEHYTYYAKDGNFEHQLIERWKKSVTGGRGQSASHLFGW